MEEIPIAISPQYIEVMTVQFSKINMIKDYISQYLVAPQWHFPCQKHSFMKYPIPEIPDDFENKSGTDRVLKKTSGSGRVSGTRWALPRSAVEVH